jgi:hypothetical protein
MYVHTQLITKDTAHSGKDVLNYQLLNHAKTYVLISRFSLTLYGYKNLQSFTRHVS